MPKSLRSKPIRHRHPQIAAGPEIVMAAWLSDRCLLLIVSHSAKLHDFEQATMREGDETSNLELASIRHPMDRLETANRTVRSVLVVRHDVLKRGGKAQDIVVSADSHQWRLEAETIVSATTDIRTVMRNQFTSLVASDRAEVIAFLASIASEGDTDKRNALRESRSLYVVREMLRERLPRCEVSASRLEGVSVEAIAQVSETAFYLEGWICDVESGAVRVTAVSPEGDRAQLIGALSRYDRPDVEAFFSPTIGSQMAPKYGFICYFELDSISRLPNGWIVEVETAAGSEMEAAAPAVIAGNHLVRTKLLADLAHDHSDDLELWRTHISPAITTLNSGLAARAHVETAVTLGALPARPAVSVLIPLYGRTDLMEHQIAQFSADPDLRDAELIYILDSPELREELLASARRLFRLYGLPFRLLVLSENAGFSLANNIGASEASGRLLLLLNSDVLPDAPGWLSTMVALYDSLDRPGALGPMLLYEDDSLQHAGLYFERPAGARFWTNEHYFKGMHRDLSTANIQREVPAVTAACMMVDAKLYQSVGGLSGAYVQGDYEDSDLCLRFLQAGRKNWYGPDIRLYHLEAQSYPTGVRQLNRQYNRWLFNDLWSATIEHLEHDGPLADPPEQRANGTGPSRSNTIELLGRRLTETPDALEQDGTPSAKDGVSVQ